MPSAPFVLENLRLLVSKFGNLRMPFVTALTVAANCLVAMLVTMPSALSRRYVTEPLSLTHDLSLVV
jgi:hypothetical protein